MPFYQSKGGSPKWQPEKPNYYDDMLAMILQGGFGFDPVTEKAGQRTAASEMEDAKLRELLGGSHSWNRGRYDFVPGYSRESTKGIDYHTKGKWDRAPRADLMYQHPHSPEKWDDYGPWEAPSGFRMPDRYFRGRRF